MSLRLLLPCHREKQRNKDAYLLFKSKIRLYLRSIFFKHPMPKNLLNFVKNAEVDSREKALLLKAGQLQKISKVIQKKSKNT